MITKGGQKKMQEALRNLPQSLQHSTTIQLVKLSLLEDLTLVNLDGWEESHLLSGDVTSSAIIQENTQGQGRIWTKAKGVVAGLPIAQLVYALLDERVELEIHQPDGSEVEPGMVLAEVTGPARSLLAGERVALNFVGRLSGIASLTHKLVQAVEGTRAVILDTRKTAPGFRRLDKYAVAMGGGGNHRMGLFDMALIKENHITAAGGIRPAVERLRAEHGDSLPIEVEVTTLEELKIALDLNLTRIMLDNMDLATMREAVMLAGGHPPLEASGNVSLETVRSIAETGVDFISSGALTHSAPALDISMILE
jgi:nicotinate-nucleotide pyrophosphorylase (carboxylating)